MKKKLLIILALMPVLSYAQDTVYKCTSPNGEVHYLNINPALSKTTGCVKMELSIPDRGVTVVNTSYNKKTTSTASPGSSPMVVFNDEQKSRDSKRQTILGKELQEEEQQLSTVSKMLSNLTETKSTDAQQLQQLSTLQATHQRNIQSLKKELGIKENNPTVSSPNNGLKIEKAISNVSYTSNTKLIK